MKEENKNSKIYVGRSATLHNLLFCARTSCMNCATETFLLVSCSVEVRVNNYCALYTVKSKNENKDLNQRPLSSFKTIGLNLCCAA